MSTHTAIFYHIVFSTKDRIPVFHGETRQGLFRYITGIIQNRHGYVYQINGVEDHVHILTSLHPTVSLADLVRDIKTGSAHWIKEKAVFRNLSNWQEGYAAFTCCKSEIPRLAQYIQSQQEHHSKVRFEDEYRKLLLEAAIEFDERYMV
jgi:putative transposase